MKLTYDVLDRLVAETTGLGTVAYQYDPLGRRTQMRVNDLNPVTYTYDAASRLRTITQAPLSPVAIDYDALGRRTRLTLPNGVSTEYQYDAASRLTSLIYRNATSILGDLTYTYDPTGNRTGVGGAFARTLLPDPVPSATYDAANRQRAFSDKALTYDVNGSLASITEPGGVTTFTWDPRNRLVALNGPGLTASFGYDALGRRGTKAVNASPTQYSYDGVDIIHQADPSGATSHLRLLNVDEALASTNAGGTHFSIHDPLGSTVAITDSVAAPVVQYTYEPFGKTSSANPAFPNPLQFTGREHDPPTGLYHYRARYYHPGLHRFTTDDPIGLLAGDPNFYAYVGNNPVNFVDPFGLDKDRRCKSDPTATRVLFTGIQFSGFLGGLSGQDRRGIGKQVTLGVAWEAGTWNFRRFSSVGRANPEDPEDRVTGISLGIGFVLPLSHIRGSFRDFEGESTEESLGYGLVQYTDITTSSGRSGSSGTVSLGLSAAATRIRTVATFPGCR